MNRAQLAHALRAAADLLGEREFVVVGSAAILGSFPEALMTDALVMSVEVGLLPPDDADEEKSITLDGAQGELSQFHQSHGFYIDGVSVNTSRSPAGWEKRVVAFAPLAAEGAMGWCLNAADLVATKAVAGRSKDRSFVIAALRQRLTDADTVLALIPTIDADQAKLTAAIELVTSHQPETTGAMAPQPLVEGISQPLKFEPAQFSGPSMSDESREV